MLLSFKRFEDKNTIRVNQQNVRAGGSVSGGTIFENTRSSHHSIKAVATGRGSSSVISGNGATVKAGIGGKASITINGKKYEAPEGKTLKVDGNKVYIDGELVAEGFKSQVLDIRWEGPAINVESEGDIHCGDIQGSVNAGLNAHVEGSVGGDVKAGTDVNCKDVQGNIKAGMGVNCGHVGGDVKAGMGVTMKKS